MVRPCRRGLLALQAILIVGLLLTGCGCGLAHDWLWDKRKGHEPGRERGEAVVLGVEYSAGRGSGERKRLELRATVFGASVHFDRFIDVGHPDDLASFAGAIQGRSKATVSTKRNIERWAGFDLRWIAARGGLNSISMASPSNCAPYSSTS